MTKSTIIKTELIALFKARNAVIWLVTPEEVRAETTIIEAAAEAKYETLLWDCESGLVRSSGEPEESRMTDPMAVINKIKTSPARAIYVLRDFNNWLQSPVTRRAIRNLARSLPETNRKEARAIVILCASSDIPPDIADQTVVLDYPLPDREEMSEILNTVIENQPESIAKTCDNGVREAAIDAAMGLTGHGAESCYAKSLVTKQQIVPGIVSSEKKKVIARERVLTWIDPDPRGLEAIGGLDGLKEWTAKRRLAFSKEAREYGLPAPKGVLLVGVPGCGKSLTAKAIPTAWGMPLLRLDMGALKSKWVGESEANIRKALAVAETVSPAVLWLDEIEKALAGSTASAADGGVSADALGSILSWMQDRQGSVFVIATANDVEKLPPELLRKGRFDELFFVDLPQMMERVAIVEATLKQFNRDTELVDSLEVAEVTEDFSGAEIAALIPDAMFTAFSQDREITTTDVIEAAAKTVPLSKTSYERITAIRAWAEGRARPASAPIKNKRSKSGRELDLK